MAAKRERTREKGIYRRGSRYCFVYRDNLGRQRSGSAATLAEARAARAAAATDVRRGEYRSLSRVTFAEYAPEWITSYRGRTARGVGEDTRDDYRKALGLDPGGKPTGGGAVAFFGNTLLASIGVPELRAYADHVASRPRQDGRKGPLARDTVRLALAPVKALLATAHEDGLIRSNPSAGARNLIPAMTVAESEVVKALAPDDLVALLAELPDEWRPFIEFLAETGLRIGEAIEVRWSDVDLGTCWLAVERRFYRGRVGLPKGRKARRVPLSARMARTLWQLRHHAADDDLVFSAGGGARIDPPNLMRRVLKPAAIEAGIGDWVGFHSLRHTCATMLLRGGWNASQVQRMLGHSDPGFTLRRYVHLLDSDLPTPSFLDALPAGDLRDTNAAVGQSWADATLGYAADQR